LGEALVEATDRAGTGGDSHEGLRDFPHLVRARPSHEHLCQTFGDMRFIATVAFKLLDVELTFPISGHSNVLQPTSRCHPITGGGAVAVAFALGAAFSPRRSNERISLLTYHQFQDRPHGALSQGTQMLMKFLLLRQQVRRLLRF